MESGLTLAWIARGTSPVDWCEDNYTVTPHIAEFANTVSNVLFLVVPAMCSKLWSSYAKQVSRGIHIVWIFFTIIGLSSAYFHATLSLLGQLLDELSILWVLLVSYSIFTPIRHRPTYLQHRPLWYKGSIAVLGILVTASAFIKPEINQYVLFLAGAPAIFICTKEIRWSNDSSICSLGLASLGTFIFAASLWVFDRFMCSFLRGFNITILHGLWHILIFASAYTMQVLFCYFHAKQDVPQSKPVLKFWPSGSWGLPYIQCRSTDRFKDP